LRLRLHYKAARAAGVKAREKVMLQGLTELLKYFRDERHYKRRQQDQALLAIRQALQETKQYLALRNRGEARSIEKEHELSNLWSIAGVHAREFGPDLARRLGEKSSYWLEPENWHVDEIYENGIKIERIDMEVSELLQRRP